MAHEGLHHVLSSEEKHLGGNMLEGDPFSYAPTTWRYLIDRFSIRSVLDLGSGMGNNAYWFHKQGLQVVAADGLLDNCKRAVFPTINIDLTKTNVYCPVDLVHCVEVVEHIEEKYIENLLDSMCNGKVILMTNALPGQGGYHHVNEQPTEYWIQKFHARGYSVALDDSQRVRVLAANDNALHVARTGLVLVKFNR